MSCNGSSAAWIASAAARCSGLSVLVVGFSAEQELLDPRCLFAFETAIAGSGAPDEGRKSIEQIMNLVELISLGCKFVSVTIARFCRRRRRRL
jgi:hypothetical protein